MQEDFFISLNKEWALEKMLRANSNWRLKYLNEGEVWDEATFENHWQVPEMVAAGMKKQQKHLAEAGLL